MQLFKLLIASKKNKFVNKKAVLIVICLTYIGLDQIYKTQKGETRFKSTSPYLLTKFNNNSYNITNDDFLKNNQPKLFF
ncbi:hypothetical protein SAMN04488131_107122 [Flavobacterium xueshanense]|uniref:Uncharacterized protein n=1 Tax=Flavobacterium xueshanense TaxID=935223 RepID=A0A1I2FET3_9FLAO|nr:hypothetical protein SAMN04488131_107122 [Flavobacterium xueshanense]